MDYTTWIICTSCRWMTLHVAYVYSSDHLDRWTTPPYSCGGVYKPGWLGDYTFTPWSGRVLKNELHPNTFTRTPLIFPIYLYTCRNTWCGVPVRHANMGHMKLVGQTTSRIRGLEWDMIDCRLWGLNHYSHAYGMGSIYVNYAITCV